MSTIAILTAGGTGTRTHQDLPKQFLTVENMPEIRLIIPNGNVKGLSSLKRITR